MIIFMGVAGAGKSVQGKLLAEALGYQWLSTGEYLRSNITPERKQEMEAGKLLADAEIFSILEEFFQGMKDQGKTILDGFPRTLSQAKWLHDRYEKGEIIISSVIYLDASQEVVKDRLKSRGRPDDSDEALSRRFEEFEELTLPILDWFKSKGVEVFEIDAEREVEAIHKDILNKVSSER